MTVPTWLIALGGAWQIVLVLMLWLGVRAYQYRQRRKGGAK